MQISACTAQKVLQYSGQPIRIKGITMLTFILKLKKSSLMILALAFLSISLSACGGTNHTEVAEWWVDQQWQSASVEGETDQ